MLMGLLTQAYRTILLSRLEGELPLLNVCVRYLKYHSNQSTFGLRENCVTCYQETESIVDRIESSGRTWKAYMEVCSNLGRKTVKSKAARSSQCPETAG